MKRFKKGVLGEEEGEVSSGTCVSPSRIGMVSKVTPNRLVSQIWGGCQQNVNGHYSLLYNVKFKIIYNADSDTINS
jgi:hypothetical protein